MWLNHRRHGGSRFVIGGDAVRVRSVVKRILHAGEVAELKKGRCCSAIIVRAIMPHAKLQKIMKLRSLMCDKNVESQKSFKIK